MNYVYSLFTEFVHNPKSLLFLVAALNALWVIYIVFLKKNYHKKIYKIYFIYAFFVLLWVLSNAYFQSSLLTNLDQNYATFLAIIANMTATFAGLGFYYLSCFIRRGFLFKRQLYFILFFAFLTLFNLWPNLTIQEVNIFADRSFKIVSTPLNAIFFLTGMIVITLSFYNFISAIRSNSQKIANAKIFYMLFGMSLLYGSVFIFTAFLPTFFSNFDYVWIPPFLSMADILLVGYAILTKRFLDIRLLVSNMFKVILSFAISIALGFAVLYSIEEIFATTSFIYSHFLGAITFLYAYIKIYKFLNSHTFNRHFGLANTEFIRKIIREIRAKNKVYKSIDELEKELQELFLKGNKKRVCQIITLNEANKDQYPELIHYFQTHRDLLITEEIRYIEEEEDRIFPFIQELESLGGVCIPLFHPSKELIGFFTLGKKSYNHLYTKNEVIALEQLGAYISLLVSEIIYSSELKKEVTSKTIELQKQIKEKNELVKQQSDFMAVTAHEFRTPLSIAIFQLEEIVNKSHKHPEIKQDLSVVEASLSHLKKLTQKLFTIQQYDLKKVKVYKEKVHLKAFVLELYNDFLPITKEKGLTLALEDHLSEDLVMSIDLPQMRQVLHNLLSNACKFTDKGGIILSAERQKNQLILSVNDTGKGIPDAMKKSIFKKFRTDQSGSGIGLGLYICQKIIELHQGDIWVENNSKDGSIFFIRLTIDESS